jgi:hypothetical protein
MELDKQIKLDLINEKISLSQTRIDLMQAKVDLGEQNKEGAPSYESLVAQEIQKKTALIEFRNSVEQEQ